MPDDPITDVDKAFEELKPLLASDPGSPVAVLAKGVEAILEGQRRIDGILAKAMEEDSEDDDSEEDDEDSTTGDGPRSPEDQEPGVEDNLGKAVSDALTAAGITTTPEQAQALAKAVGDILETRVNAAVGQAGMDITDFLYRSEARATALHKAMEGMVVQVGSLAAQQVAVVGVVQNLAKAVGGSVAPTDRTPVDTHPPVVLDGGKARHETAVTPVPLSQKVLAKGLQKGVFSEVEYANLQKSRGAQFSPDPTREAQIRTGLAQLGQ